MLPKRVDYVQAIARVVRPQDIIVSCLSTNVELHAIADRPRTFYIIDAMGLALPIAVGVAVSHPHLQVLATEGDGGSQMHLGAVATLGKVAPPNLTVLLINNGIYEASGGQVIPNDRLDFTAFARAAGIPRCCTVESPENLATELTSALSAATTTFITCLAAPAMGEESIVPFELQAGQIRHRFREALRSG